MIDNDLFHFKNNHTLSYLKIFCNEYKMVPKEKNVVVENRYSTCMIEQLLLLSTIQHMLKLVYQEK